MNWNTCELLIDCLKSIRTWTDPEEVQTIVVDNASSDKSTEMIENSFPEVRLIKAGANIGFGRANNMAIPHAVSPLILFLNPDTVIIDDSINKMIRFIKANPNVGGLGSQLIHSDGLVHTLGLQWFPSPITEFINIIFLTDRMIHAFRKYLPYQDPNESGYVKKIYGTAFMVKREVIENIGFFDERFFMYGEDVDLSRRIIDAGWHLYYLADTKIVHHVAGASGKSTSQFSALMKCESISKLMTKYYGNTGSFFYRTAIFSGSIFRLLILYIISIKSLFKTTLSINNYKNSIYKYIAMLKWSLGLQRPVIGS